MGKTKRQSPRGKAYQYSALYRNAVILRLLIKKFTGGLNPKKHHRLISQLDSSARSVVANIREGYVRPTTNEYSTFLGYSHGSLEEIRGDIIDAKDDGSLKSKPASTLASIGILLKPPKSPPTTESQAPLISSCNHLRDLKSKVGETRDGSSTSKTSYKSPKPSYDPLGDLKRKIKAIVREQLTYEIFIELINKTDWLLKQAVRGLDRKIISDEKKKLKEEIDGHWRKNW